MTGREPATGSGVRPDAVLFDMDGTLVDTEKLWDAALGDLARHLGGELSEPARLAMIGTNVSVSVGVLFEDLGLPSSPAAEARARLWLSDRAAALYAEPLPWRPGAEELLLAVRAAGIATALVTNTERPLAELGLVSLGRDRFDATVCGDEVAAPKPAPDPYVRAAELLGTTPARCLAIEDSPTGVRAAADAGCTVLVVPLVLPVEPGPRRVFRETLAGLTVADLALAP